MSRPSCPELEVLSTIRVNTRASISTGPDASCMMTYIKIVLSEEKWRSRGLSWLLFSGPAESEQRGGDAAQGATHILAVAAGRRRSGQ